MSNKQQHNKFVLPILVTNQSARQSYVFDLIFKQLIGIDYSFLTESIDGKYLGYGEFESDFCLPNSNYLYKSTVDQPSFENVEFEDKIFPFASSNHFFPFDPFATCFYVVTRHEEYNNKGLDVHGRYKHQNSWLSKNEWLKTPIINYIAELLKQKIEAYFDIKIENVNKFTVNPTLDIDNPFAYYGREKPFFPSIVKSILKFDFKEANLKLSSKNNLCLDPFNTHSKIIKDIETIDAEPTVFFLMNSGKMDSICSIKAINKAIEVYKNTIFEIAIHPSYYSGKLSSEIKALEDNLDVPVKSSRHHFIKAVIPRSYQELIEKGITHDYSMGYPNENGFRAGICNEYLWFDLEKNEPTNLKVTPFCFMDATYIFNLKTSVSEALHEINDLSNTVYKYKGKLSFVFHNESISNHDVYHNWGQLWQETMQKIASLQKTE